MSTISTPTPTATTQPQGRAWLKIVAVAVPLALLTMLASPQAPLGGFWGPTSTMVQPNGLQTTLFILLDAVQSLSFGLGVAFLLFGYPLVRALNPQRPALALATHLAVAWQLINWWPHSNLHATTAMDNLNRLLTIEYGFHVTLIISGLIIAYFLLAAFRARVSGSQAQLGKEQTSENQNSSTNPAACRPPQRHADGLRGQPRQHQHPWQQCHQPSDQHREQQPTRWQ